jgi:hypothetical protein
MPAPEDARVLSSSIQDLNSLHVDGQARQIAEQERTIIKLNQEFAELAFSVRDFNRVSSASDPQLSVVTPPVRLREDKEKQENRQQHDQELQVAA